MARALPFLALLLARLVLWFAWPPMQAAAGGIGQGLYQGDVLDWLHRTPFDLAVTAFLLLAAVTLSVDPVRRVRAEPCAAAVTPGARAPAVSRRLPSPAACATGYRPR